MKGAPGGDRLTCVFLFFLIVFVGFIKKKPCSSDLKHTITPRRHFSPGAPAHTHKHAHARTQGQLGRCRVICIMKQARSPKGRRCAPGSNEGCAYGRKRGSVNSAASLTLVYTLTQTSKLNGDQRGH